LIEIIPPELIPKAKPGISRDVINGFLIVSFLPE
jgi:hypothetical protein